MSGQEQLKSQIIDNDLCSSCGMCVGLCPYIKTARDAVRIIYPCGLEEGTCYRVCPKAPVDVRETDLAVFGRERDDQALGVMKGIYFARAVRDKAPGAQYGGVTTALAALALDQGMVSGMAAVGGDALHPRPVLARTAAEVACCAGSKYTGVPTLEVINRAVKEGMSGLGVVGRPCQIAAVRKAQRGGHPGPQFSTPGAVVLALGLFCFWSLTPEFYGFLAGQVKGEKVLGMDIPVEGPLVTTESGTYRWAIDEIRPFIKKSCNLCMDSTSEWADLSIGSTECDPQWNTLIVRTETGENLFNLALAQNIIEVRDYPPDRLPLLKRATLNKKRRVMGLPEYQAGGPGSFMLTEKYREQIEAQWGGVSQ